MPIFTDISRLAEQNYDEESLILGFGGHGSESLIHRIINNQHIKHHIILTPMDSGGCTGRIQKYLQSAILNLENSQINQFKKDKNPIALGDLKNNIKVWLLKTLNNESDQKIVEKCFDLRSQSYADFNYHFELLTQVFPFLQKYNDSFLALAKSYLEILAQSGESQEKTSFGNLFLQVIYNQSKNHSEFFNELKANLMIPKNVYLYFLVNEQLTLKAKTQGGKELNSESEIDVYQNDPVQIESYKLYNSSNQLVDINYIFENNPEIKELFTKWKILKDPNVSIILSPGSISNFISILNTLHKELNELCVPIVWITNAFVQSNEQGLPSQIEAVHKMFAGNNYPLIILGVSKNPYDFIEDVEMRRSMQEAYALEGKTQVNQRECANYCKTINHNAIYLPLMKVIPVKSAGLKYPTIVLEQYINRLISLYRLIYSVNQSPEVALKKFVERVRNIVPKEFAELMYTDLPPVRYDHQKIIMENFQNHKMLT